MLRMFRSSLSRISRVSSRLTSNSVPSIVDDKPWLNPWKHAIPHKDETHTSYSEASVDWSLVERVIPRDIVPDLPRHSSYPTPSGWRPPLDPPPSLPYHVSRKRDHLFPLYLERRRDTLNEKSLDFDYVELVTLKGIDGDVFACEADLRSYLEEAVGHPVTTHVDELKGRIKVKGADRSHLEKFLFEKGF
ncbi:hypothetical protein PMAYCL1PPCAC_29503 [Pristionchus mayeri]|uniref:Large ribosomal subunit protein mL49 n=1 Tax=Pristionchus mayeri TaxID=1317129 RepID=A0AAN5IAX9_9BILA|nr:hypothetical protein PMAYCL1PPCAC_29503 [Pristionchus mayeri]